MDGSPAVRIAILVEGKTEQAFKPHLQAFLKTRLEGRMPKLDIVPQDKGIPTGQKLRRLVQLLLNDRKRAAGLGSIPTSPCTTSKPGCCRTGTRSNSLPVNHLDTPERDSPRRPQNKEL